MKKNIITQIMVLLICCGCQTTRQVASTAGSLVGAIGLTGALVSGGLLVGAKNAASCTGGGGSGYALTDNTITLGRCKDGFRKICESNEMDVTSFYVLGSLKDGSWWASDKDHLYRNCTAVSGLNHPGQYIKPSAYKHNSGFTFYQLGQGVIMGNTWFDQVSLRFLRTLWRSRSLFTDGHQLWYVSQLHAALIEGINVDVAYLIDERIQPDFSGFEVIYADAQSVFHNEHKIADNPDTFDLEAYQRSYK